MLKTTVKRALIVVIAGLVLLGCGVSKYSANTVAKYKVCDALGNCSEFYYDSETEKKLVVEIVKDGDDIKVFKFSLESGTSDAALAATANANSKLAEFIEKLAPAILKMGAMSGS